MNKLTKQTSSDFINQFIVSIERFLNDYYKDKNIEIKGLRYDVLATAIRDVLFHKHFALLRKSSDFTEAEKIVMIDSVFCCYWTYIERTTGYTLDKINVLRLKKNIKDIFVKWKVFN